MKICRFTTSGIASLLLLTCEGMLALAMGNVCKCVAQTTENCAAVNRPNVVVMIADDLGYGDVSCLLRTVVTTPNIDRLAKTGVKFTDGYASCPLCAPSRAGFLAGVYQQRFGVDNNSTDTIPREVPLFPRFSARLGMRLACWENGTAACDRASGPANVDFRSSTATTVPF